MKSALLSALRSQFCRAGTARRFQSLCLPVLVGWLLVVPACSQEVSPTQQASPPPLETALASTSTPPGEEVPRSDPWAAYRSLLVGDTQDKQREIFSRGYRFAQEKNYAGAYLFLSRALDVYPILADYSLYYLATAQRAAGQTG